MVDRYSQPLILPCPATIRVPQGSRVIEPRAQLSIFCCLATNNANFKGTKVEELDQALGQESVFYACRAVRRLLLGTGGYPFIDHVGRAPAIIGTRYYGQGLIIQKDCTLTFMPIYTDQYLPVVYTLEMTDQQPRALRALYFDSLATNSVDYREMLRLVIRYLRMSDLERCYESFVETLPRRLARRCEQNFSILLSPLQPRSTTILPPAAGIYRIEFLRFCVKGFMAEWPLSGGLSELCSAVTRATLQHPTTLMRLFRVNAFQEIEMQSGTLLDAQTQLGIAVPALATPARKREPEGLPWRICVVSAPKRTWLACTSALHRIVLCLVDPENITHQPTQHPHGAESTPVRALAAALRRVELAPKDRTSDFSFCGPWPQSVECQVDALEDFDSVKHVSINAFKINIFNTNTVVNTKIICSPGRQLFTNILNIPRLNNNFVVRKYSAKEPASTVSIFYSEDLSHGAAINVNISGDLLTFLAAMSNLRTLLPVVDIYRASMANWNSTLDLQGLENQGVVRAGRSDVFWTTNFPSAVSTKRGFSVSWFKAATATVSRIHGERLRARVIHEAMPIITDPRTKVNTLKNATFAALETRNRAQIQVLHKRFLECLFACCSFMRLDTRCIRRLVTGGVFDYAKRIISHTKNKHECALLGYKRCNLIPKVFGTNKKIRLDELGRNANFLTFASSLAPSLHEKRNRILRHVVRTFGLHWRSHSFRHKRRLVSGKDVDLPALLSRDGGGKRKSRYKRLSTRGDGPLLFSLAEIQNTS